MANAHVKSNITRVSAVVRSYPLPILALSGLAAGGVAYLGLGQWGLASWIWYGTLIVGGAQVIVRTLRGMLKGKFAADIVAMLAIITAVLTDEAFAGVIIVLMQTGGEAIDDYGFRRASSSLEALLARAPRTARRKRNDTVEEIDVHGVSVGDILVVRPGDLIPVDGSITSGPAEVDESALTGEPLSRTKSVDETLMSGSLNVGSAFEMKATKVSAESGYTKIVELVKKAQEEKPPIQRLADRYAVWFTPATLILAAFGWLITQSLTAVLAVLVVATPCPLILATPLAVISGVNRAAKESIIVKSGAAIEQIGKVRVVIFDKTGTITHGTPVIERIVPIIGTEEEMLKKAASIEQFSSHPVAVSLAQEGRDRYSGLLPVVNVREAGGQGIEADIGGEHIVIGSQRYVETKIGREFDSKAKDVLRDAQRKGSLVSFIAVQGEPAGIIVFSDQLRPGVPSMIQSLSELGVEHTVMLTGDNRVNAGTIAREAGIERVEANLLPEQKVEEVRKLNSMYQNTMMVGDGINDAPALATATVGVAMGAHGTGISAEAADIVLLVDDVTKVRDGIEIGQRTLHIAKQSIYFGIGVSIVLMIIASFGYIQPAAGAVMQEALDISVILNALRAR
ncbi:MAG TPA: heavy metal translocating P-type ATPase [Nitrososphaerales archaeon]|nr:heavy metal translocating P-type ATPase [Nitrososphaerales archaeon]